MRIVDAAVAQRRRRRSRFVMEVIVLRIPQQFRFESKEGETLEDG